jgi:TPR repeat protein
MGIMNLHGLGGRIDIERALEFFKRAQNDSKAINAIGYIYYTAPDFLEIDPVILSKYGKIR